MYDDFEKKTEVMGNDQQSGLHQGQISGSYGAPATQETSTAAQTQTGFTQAVQEMSVQAPSSFAQASQDAASQAPSSFTQAPKDMSAQAPAAFTSGESDKVAAHPAVFASPLAGDGSASAAVTTAQGFERSDNSQAATSTGFSQSHQMTGGEGAGQAFNRSSYRPPYYQGQAQAGYTGTAQTAGFDQRTSASGYAPGHAQASQYMAQNGQNPGYSFQAGEKPDQTQDKVKAKKKTEKGFFAKAGMAVVFGLLFGVVAGAAIYGIQYAGAKLLPASQESSTAAPAESGQIKAPIEQVQPVIPEDSRTMAGTSTSVYDASQVVEDVMPSIVAITNKYVQYYESFWGMPEQIESEASGSGIIVGENDTELLVVTNSHVVEGTSDLKVQFVDGEVYDAQIKGSKAEQDLAVIAIKLADMSDATKSKIKIATLGDSDSLKVGEPAIAIGNSLGYGQTVTSGIISALERDFTYEDTTRQVIQTDAAINPGNSGGALLNISGEVIGINEAKYASTSVEGVGYAIPISTAKPIIDDLATKTTRSKVDKENAGFLGVAGVDVTSEVSSLYGMPVGVYVAQVTEDSAAEKAGIQKGDIITEFDGETVATMEELKRAVESYPAGTEVEVRIKRTAAGGYEESVIKVVLGKRAESNS